MGDSSLSGDVFVSDVNRAEENGALEEYAMDVDHPVARRTYHNIGVISALVGVMIFTWLGLLSILAGVQLYRHYNTEEGIVIAAIGCGVVVFGLVLGSVILLLG